MGYKRKKTKAKINWGWDNPEDRNGKATRITKRQQKQIKKDFKLISLKTLAISLIVLVLFAGVGAIGGYFLTKDDCFKLLGNSDIFINVDDFEDIKDCCYIEDGYKITEFSKDVSNKVEIETNMLVNTKGYYTPVFDEIGNPVLGKYYIIYKAKTFKYSKFSKIERVRFVTFEEVTDVLEGGN